MLKNINSNYQYINLEGGIQFWKKNELPLKDYKQTPIWNLKFPNFLHTHYIIYNLFYIVFIKINTKILKKLKNKKASINEINLFSGNFSIFFAKHLPKY